MLEKDYPKWKIARNVILSIIGFALFVVLMFGLELGSIKLGGILKTERANVERQVFKETKSYNEGMANDLANYKLEYELSQDEVERQAIRRHIIDKYSDFDETKLQSYSLKQFLISMRGGY